MNVKLYSEDPIMTETEVISTVNPVVPRDISPQELLLILPEDKHLKVYYQCKEEEDPNWVPQYVGFPTRRSSDLFTRVFLWCGYQVKLHVHDLLGHE